MTGPTLLACKQLRGAFALLPLPDVDASLREIAHSLDTLGLDGAGVLTNDAGAYLGDRRFAPLFDELQPRMAVVFIHPTQPPRFVRLGLGLPPVWFSIMGL